ncbi:MAG: hypothetical protein ACXWAS_03850 [Methylobacter sp.]
MAIDLYVLADSVFDEKSFLHFLAALAADREEEQALEKSNPSSPYSSGALGWENGSVGAVLDAAVSWGNASFEGLAHYEKPQNPWRRAAHIIHAGKFYE